jgi:hypothetical protein
MLPLCPTLLASAEPCLLPLVEGQDCPHRDPGPAPAAFDDLVAALRIQVDEARQVASGLASLTRYLRGDQAVDLICERMSVGPQPGRRGTSRGPAGAPAGRTGTCSLPHGRPSTVRSPPRTWPRRPPTSTTGRPADPGVPRRRRPLRAVSARCMSPGLHPFAAVSGHSPRGDCRAGIHACSGRSVLGLGGRCHLPAVGVRLAAADSTTAAAPPKISGPKRARAPAELDIPGRLRARALPRTNPRPLVYLAATRQLNYAPSAAGHAADVQDAARG